MLVWDLTGILKGMYKNYFGNLSWKNRIFSYKINCVSRRRSFSKLLKLCWKIKRQFQLSRAHKLTIDHSQPNKFFGKKCNRDYEKTFITLKNKKNSF